MKKWLMLTVLAVACAGGLYVWLGLSKTQVLSEKSLTFADVQRATIRDIVSATGLVEPREIVLVSSESAGLVMHMSARVGDIVSPGAELALLDTRLINLKIEEAKNGLQTADAAHAQAKAALTQAAASKEAAQRYLKIQKELATTTGFRTEREQAEAQYQAAIAGIEAAQAGIELTQAKKLTAQTALKEAELMRDLARIKVPSYSHLVPGALKREFLILERKIHEGQLVGPQSGPLFTLAGSLDVVEVHAQIAEGDVNKVRRGLTALFKITNFNDEEIEFTGTVKETRPLASTIKGAVYYDAVIEVENRKDPITKDWQLRPGMTASVDIIRHERKNAWRVPSTALNFKLDEPYQTSAVREQVARWMQRPDKNAWRVLWTWDSTLQRPSPVFVRIDGKKDNEPGLKDSEGNEILEWESGKEPGESLRVIITAPPARPPGFLDQPANLKI